MVFKSTINSLAACKAECTPGVFCSAYRWKAPATLYVDRFDTVT